MTVQEAKELIMQVPLYRYECELERGRQSDLFQALNVSIQAIEEVEQYRALGTVEELKEAREKQIPKNPTDIDEECGTFVCPSCESMIYSLDDIEVHKHCLICGQKLDWRDKP